FTPRQGTRRTTGRTGVRGTERDSCRRREGSGVDDRRSSPASLPARGVQLVSGERRERRSPLRRGSVGERQEGADGVSGDDMRKGLEAGDWWPGVGAESGGPQEPR